VLLAGGEANVYVHHDILLPAFPLSLAWTDFSAASSAAGNQGNMVAVGSMEPCIEIWDLDIADQVEPVMTLGGAAVSTQQSQADAADAAGKSKNAKHKAKQKAKKKAKQQQQQLKPGSHSGAVMSLSWNKEFRNVLASGSADNTVKVWDMAAGQCEHTLTHHSDKVQAVAWNPSEPPVLLSGSYDRTSCLVRRQQQAGSGSDTYGQT
jgi:periodic tryptophan protein 1